MANNAAQWYHSYVRQATKQLPIEKMTGMYSRCPGQDSQNLRAALYKCPKCGAEVEIFSDEVKVKCRNCGESVYTEKTPSCIEWCAAARQCLGEERWKQFRDAIEGQKTKPKDSD